MDEIEREALTRAAIDPDAEPAEVAGQLWVRELLMDVGQWRRQQGLAPLEGIPPRPRPSHPAVSGNGCTNSGRGQP
ncbi:MAG: hypothetical protein J2P18_14765 [Nocardia sp.]|nr:hypothetical protein [Nocardia sp.]